MRAGAAVRRFEDVTTTAPPPLALVERSDAYDIWLADFSRRLALHDASVAALAKDIALRTRWLVQAVGSPDFPAPAPALGAPPDVLCLREGRPPLCLEVELPETLVRRQTVNRLRMLSDRMAFDTRLVLVAPAREHGRRIDEGERLLRRARLKIPVAAIAADEDAITGADW
jgi:hypothetical protein